MPGRFLRGLSVSSAQILELWSAVKAQSLVSKIRHCAAMGSLDRKGSSAISKGRSSRSSPGVLPPFQGWLIQAQVDPGLTPWAKVWRRYAAGQQVRGLGYYLTPLRGSANSPEA